MFTKFNLTKSQKTKLYKIIISIVLLIIGVILEKYSKFSIIFYLLAYFIVGHAVLEMALSNLTNGRVFDENFLMAIATIGAFILKENAEAVFVMVFYQVGELFESIAIGKSRKSIQSLLEYAPDEARLIMNGEEVLVEPDEVSIGDQILVLAGEKIPLDGIIVEGKSSLNMAFLTGESLPKDVETGDFVHSGAINTNGVLRIRVTNDFEDSTVSKILDLIENSSQKKSVLENFITRFSKYYTGFVVISALLVAILPPLIFKAEFWVWLRRALIFLVVSCPCALVISVPLSFFGGIGSASKNGILVKGSNFLEALSMADTFVFDKTGTLTQGKFSLTDTISYSDNNWEILASSLESFSTHPIAESIVKLYGKEYVYEISKVEEIHGKGLIASYHGQRIAAGNEKLMVDLGLSPNKVEKLGTKVYFSMGDSILGVLVIGDTVKEESKQGLDELKKSGINNLYLLTGDKEDVAKEISKNLGITKFYSELLPEDKLRIFEEILENKKKNKTVAYVGDGINDAPVLMRADIGIAMGALGTDAAIEAADIVLMDDKVSKLDLAVNIAKKTIMIARQNVFMAIGIKFLVLGLSLFGLASMWMAIFADVGVMVLAVLNSMRTLSLE